MHVPLDERVAARFTAGESDLRVAERLHDSAAHIACFHAQQGAEKAHAIVRIFSAIDALTQTVPPEIRDQAGALDKYYIPTRYPDAARCLHLGTRVRP